MTVVTKTLWQARIVELLGQLGETACAPEEQVLQALTDYKRAPDADKGAKLAEVERVIRQGADAGEQ
jgi:hypothetical protein